jgi:P-type Ca2+ transporter type 2A
LSEYSPDEAKVLRDGRPLRVRSEFVVPGDIVILSQGDRVPADCRLFIADSNSFRVDQAILTGESESVEKFVGTVPDPKAVKQDQVNMAFSVCEHITLANLKGTTVTVGNGRAIVTSTGTSTAIGDIHTSIISQISERTPLKQKLDGFGNMLAKVISVICVLVWLINYRNFTDPIHHGWFRGAVYYVQTPELDVLTIV